jgi:WXG100 family type VII secretion target
VAEIKVTSAELRSVSGSLQNGAGTVNEQLAAMKRQVDTLVSANWTGAASASFNDMYQQWNQAAGQLSEALQGISTMLAQSAQTYEETEAALESSFRRA